MQGLKPQHGRLGLPGNRSRPVATGLPLLGTEGENGHIFHDNAETVFHVISATIACASTLETVRIRSRGNPL